LHYNSQEARQIAQIINKGQYFVGAEATKSKFVEMSPGYDMLHIASHGILNDTASAYSYIVFAEEKTPVDDYRLYVRDLYNLDLSSSMVTLSACETGLGEVVRGEGIISLARGFSYAGTQSIVTTLWSVNDLSTSYIMEAFYTNLKKGYSKDKALHLAKEAYFSSQVEDFMAHPFFWAACIPIGNMDPLYNSFNWWWLIIPFVLVLIFILRNRRSQKIIKKPLH